MRAIQTFILRLLANSAEPEALLILLRRILLAGPAAPGRKTPEETA